MCWHYGHWLFARMFLRRSPVIRVRDQIRVGEFASFSEYWFRRHGLDREDLRVIEFARRFLPPCSVVADVGANLGFFTLALAGAGFEEVHAFEPTPDTCERLRANVRRNAGFAKRVVVVDHAVGAIDGDVIIVVQAGSPGQNRIACAADDVPANRRLVRRQVRLDTYFASSSKPAFLKVDVEGFETEVLRGATRLLRSGAIQFIYAEIIEQALLEAGSSVAEIDELLREFGFQPVIFSADTISPVPLSKAISWAGERRNVLFHSCR
ncbi:MAG: FkbM family methyltransferase [Chthoniobacterales bacterium]|jgi:FkbM family methyltransferase|nr:FkbM family methyltransferase [Chthoniobacterales bacterium]